MDVRSPASEETAESPGPAWWPGGPLGSLHNNTEAHRLPVEVAYLMRALRQEGPHPVPGPAAWFWTGPWGGPAGPSACTRPLCSLNHSSVLRRLGRARAELLAQRAWRLLTHGWFCSSAVRLCLWDLPPTCSLWLEIPLPGDEFFQRSQVSSPHSSFGIYEKYHWICPPQGLWVLMRRFNFNLKIIKRITNYILGSIWLLRMKGLLETSLAVWS